MTDGNNSDVTITSREHFQATLTTLSGLHDKLAGTVNDASKVAAALTAAAGKRVVPAGDAGSANTTPAAGTVAPAYTAALTAVGAAVDNASAQAGPAGTSVQNAVSDLTSLLQGLSAIDSGGADKVQAV